jgi:hypothetical protein
VLGVSPAGIVAPRVGMGDQRDRQRKRGPNARDGGGGP